MLHGSMRIVARSNVHISKNTDSVKIMPTILREGRYRFFFFSNESTEPRHVHVESADGYAKFWLEPVELMKSIGYKGIKEVS